MERLRSSQQVALLILRLLLLLHLSTGVMSSDAATESARNQRHRKYSEMPPGVSPEIRHSRRYDVIDKRDPPTSDTTTGRVVQIPPEMQREILDQLKRECEVDFVGLDSSTVSSAEDFTQSSDFCKRTWDGMVCWESAPAGQLSKQPCPYYIHGFVVNGFATRQCEENGQWYFSPVFNRTWSNYSECIAPETPPDLHLASIWSHMRRMRLIYYIGYSLSLIVLLVAVTIMLSLRKLRCPRNLLHINLFFSFIFRAVLALSRDMLMSEGSGMSGDVTRDENGTAMFSDDASHWECRLLMTVFNFVLVSNHSWIFVEGLYLHTLLFVTVFSETSSILPYVVFGWTMPFVCVFIWAMVRLTMENILCWNTHPNPAILWIMRGPILALIIVNFVFFLNVIRVLFTKLRAFNSPDSRRYRHRKLVKSALVLIPLFGVPYICFIAFQHHNGGDIEIAKLYFETTFNSFNGTIVAALYCFFNGEVQSEVRKKFQRYSAVNVRERNSRRTTLTSNLFPTRSCGQQSFRSPVESTAEFDHDDHMMGIRNELTVTSKCSGGGAVLGHDRRASSSSWNSDSSAIQLKVMNNGKAGRVGGAERQDAVSPSGECLHPLNATWQRSD